MSLILLLFYCRLPLWNYLYCTNLLFVISRRLSSVGVEILLIFFTLPIFISPKGSMKMYDILWSEVNVDCGNSVMFWGISFEKMSDFLKTEKRTFYELPDFIYIYRGFNFEQKFGHFFIQMTPKKLTFPLPYSFGVSKWPKNGIFVVCRTKIWIQKCAFLAFLRLNWLKLGVLRSKFYFTGIHCLLF